MPAYVPEKGDLITLSFDPQAGHEQKGRRPALIISNYLFNQATGLAIACPITNTDRKIPFHFAIVDGAVANFPALRSASRGDVFDRQFHQAIDGGY